jgi:hypothetical protein
MNRSVWVTAAAVLLAVGLASGQLGYVECSSGFQGNPEMEGGRTELEFADINNDGNIDIISIGDHGSPYINTQEHGVMVWFGDGHGGWSVFQYGDFGYGGIAIGDVNWDGKWDIGYGMHHNYSGVDLGDDMLEVALGDGTGQMWTAWDDSLVPGGTVWGEFSTDFADVDNDGNLDVGSTSFGYGMAVRVFLNNGDGTWHESFTTAEVNNGIEFYFRDVNRDGNADVINAGAGPAVYFGDGLGGFAPGDTGLPQSDHGLSGVSPGDVDNDGGCDLAFANTNGGVEVWVFDEATRRWQSFSGSLPASGAFEGTQLCDMNADGFVDVCALGGAHLKVWLGDGQGNWTEAADITTPTPGYYTAFRTGADFDHNGLPDLVFITEEGSWPSEQNVAHAFRETSSVSGLSVFPVFPRGGEKVMDGSAQFIDWWSEASGAESTRVKLELSTTGSSGPWQLIADTLRNAGRYQWLVPQGIVSGDCYIRYTVSGPGDTVEGITPRAFIIGDTVLGVTEPKSLKPQASSYKLGATIVRGVLLLQEARGEMREARCELLDISGRKVLDLHLGANDVSRLAPGVYFVRAEPSAASRQPSAVTKVVIQR